MLTASSPWDSTPDANCGHQVVSHCVMELLRILILVVNDNVQRIFGEFIYLLQGLVHAVPREGVKPVDYHSDFLLLRVGVQSKLGGRLFHIGSNIF